MGTTIHHLGIFTKNINRPGQTLLGLATTQSRHREVVCSGCLTSEENRMIKFFLGHPDSLSDSSLKKGILGNEQCYLIIFQDVLLSL